MKILAIDPGYDRVGIAIISNEKPLQLLYSSCITTNKKSSHNERLVHIFDEIVSLIKEWKIDCIGLETLFFSVNKKTVIKVAEARGVVVLISGIYKIPLIELSPQEVKVAMTGVGNANKNQVQKMVSLTLKIDTNKKLDDEIDAIALGFATVEYLRIKSFEKN